MPAVSSVSFLIFIYVLMKLFVPNGLPYVFLSRKNIKNINLFVSRGLYTTMLAICIRHIWVCSILIILSGDIEKNPGPKFSSCDKFSICHWNLNSISAHNFIKISLLCVYVSTHNFDVLCLSETYLDSSVYSDDNNLTIPGYGLYKAHRPSNVKCTRARVCVCEVGGWQVCIYYKHFLLLKVIASLFYIIHKASLKMT